jgi:hypothetical protein
MDPSGDDYIARLLRLKRYEKPPPDYFENFLHEFHRRQRERDELFRQPLSRICVECVEAFVLRLNIRSLASAGIAVVIACAAVVSLRLHEQPDTAQLAVQGSPIPSTPSTTGRELDFAPPVLNATFDTQPTLRARSRRYSRAAGRLSVRFEEFVPLNLEWESLEDQPVLEK